MAAIIIKGLDKMKAQLNGPMQEKLTRAMSNAMNNSMNDAKLAEQREMNAVFDRPTPYTLGSVAVDYMSLSRGKPTGAIRLRRGMDAGKSPSAMYPEIFGGARKIKGAENHLRAAGILPPDKFLVPSKASDRDSYGNIPGYVYVKMLADLQSFQVSSFKRSAKMNRTVQSALSSTRQFYVRVINGQPIGIYKRVGSMGSSKKWSTVRDIPYFNFGSKPYYKQRYDFSGIAVKTIKARFYREFQVAWKNVLAK